MSLRDIDENNRVRVITKLDHEDEFDKQWKLIPADQRAKIETELNRRLDDLVSSPNPKWGSIMNTSIEGGQLNEKTGVRGDWTDTVFDPIYSVACGYSEQQAGMLFGNIIKMVIIDRCENRGEKWIGIRQQPTFPQRGITLQGKTYFLEGK
jgi:hypothetical protein